MPNLVTPDGKTLNEDEVNRQFAEAMAAPEPDEPQHPAPPPVDAADEPAPEQADRSSHAKPRTTSGGRRRGRPPGKKKADAPPPAPAEGTFVRPVQEFLQGLTIAAAVAPLPPSDLRTRVRLQAVLVDQHSAGLAAAVDAAARNNTTIRRAVEALTMGSAGWVLPAVMAVAPFAAQSLSVWRGEISEGLAEMANGFADGLRQQLQGMQGAGSPAGA